MKLFKTTLNDAFVLEPKVYGDERGFFYESFNEKIFFSYIKHKFDFVQDNHSRSK